MAGSISLTNSSGNTILLNGESFKHGIGKVFQTVGYVTAVQGSQTISTVDTVVNNIAKVIIPKGFNSQFLVYARWFGEVVSAWDTCWNIHMDGVRVNINGQGRNWGIGIPAQGYYAGDDNSTPETMSFHTLVQTASLVGVPISFSLVMDTSSSRTLWNNRCFGVPASNYECGTSEIIITEIGA